MVTPFTQLMDVSASDVPTIFFRLLTSRITPAKSDIGTPTSLGAEIEHLPEASSNRFSDLQDLLASVGGPKHLSL
jgi:hypothetical protein